MKLKGLIGYLRILKAEIIENGIVSIFVLFRKAVSKIIKNEEMPLVSEK